MNTFSNISSQNSIFLNFTSDKVEENYVSKLISLGYVNLVAQINWDISVYFKPIH